MTMPRKVRLAPRIWRAALAALLSPALLLSSPLVAAQAQQGPTVIRDAEIEALIRDYARPLLNAAGLSRSGVEIVLVNDRSFNAFVAGRRMFMNVGTLMIAETPNEVIGVIAHEAGHIAGGHNERLRQQIERAKTLAVVAGLLGVGAVAAGAATNSKGLAGVGQGVAMGSGELAMRSLMAYQRSEETTADRSALTYLEATGQSARGMIATFRRFASALSLSGSRIDPYLSSHPMPADRISALQTLASQSKYWNKPDPAGLQERHDFARIKIAAYTEGQAAVARISRTLRSPVAQKYGLALSTYLSGNPAVARERAQELVKLRPKNAFFRELLGDVLMKANRPAEAAEAYGVAARLGGDTPLLQIARGQALIATGNPKRLPDAIAIIRRGLTSDPDNAGAYRFLAQAHGQLGEIGEAELASAEGNFYSGNIRDARIFAARAQTKLKKGTPAWLRAQDIISYKQPTKK